MKLATCLILAVAIGQAAAWNCPGGVKGADQISGYSPFFGVKGENKPMKYSDQVNAWKKYGSITKINLYYSWSHGCLQGIKVTYGYDSRNAQVLGLSRSLAEKHLALAPFEFINKVEVKESEANKCIEWIKLYTNKTASVAIGDDQGVSPVLEATVNRKAGFLAAVRGYEDYYPGQAITKGGLQQLQFVWGIGVCPTPPLPSGRPSASPSPAPVVEGPPPSPESPSPVDSPAPEGGPEGPAASPSPEPEPEPEPLCPPVKDRCDEEAASGAAFCPALSPFTTNQCAGGCCVSAGKCKKGLCHKVGLGAEVLGKDMFCWGVNKGFLNRFNRCRNLACKLAVPGCMGDLFSGACVGSVVALSDDVHEGAKQWVGYPCLQTIPAGLPLDALGRMDLNGAYAAKLWSVCNCKATKKLPGYSLGTCKGPLCSLLRKPDLPSLNFALPSFNISDVARIIDVKPFQPDLGELFDKPNVTRPQIDFKGSLEGIKALLNATLTNMSQPLQAAHTQLNATGPAKPELPSSLSVNIPKPGANLSQLAPQVDLSAIRMDKQGLQVFDMSSMDPAQANALDGVLRAFNMQQQGQGRPQAAGDGEEEGN